MVTFKSTTFEFDKPIEKGSSNTVVWEFEGDPSKIVHIQPNCGCTANCKVDGNKIVAEYTDNVGVSIDPNIIDSHYPSGKATFEKRITVFLEDKEDLYVHEGMDKRLNRNKTNVELVFKGKVNLK